MPAVNGLKPSHMRHLEALKSKHADLENKIHEEIKHSAWREDIVKGLKLEKLQLKQEISSLEQMKDQA